VDKIISEPIGGGHRNRNKVIEDTGNAIDEFLKNLSNQHGNQLKHSRQERYLQIGRTGLFSEKTTAANDVLDSKYGYMRENKNLFKRPVFIFSIVVFTIILLTIYLIFFSSTNN
jgi:hypothetical protein